MSIETGSLKPLHVAWNRVHIVATLPTKVFAIPELLENILCNLDIKQLFTVQRVSKTFQGTIKGSKKVRRIMFIDHGKEGKMGEVMFNRLSMDNVTRKRPLYPVIVDKVGHIFRPSEKETYLLLYCYMVFETEPKPTLEDISVLRSGSWRTMKIYNGAYPITIDTIGFGVDKETLELSADATLGDLADMVSKEVEIAARKAVSAPDKTISHVLPQRPKSAMEFLEEVGEVEIID